MILILLPPYRVVITSTHFVLIVVSGLDEEISCMEDMLDVITSEKVHEKQPTSVRTRLIPSLIEEPSTPWEIRAVEGTIHIFCRLFDVIAITLINEV